MSEQAMQEQPQQMPYGSPMRDLGSSIVTLTNPENELYRLELTLRNMNPSDDGKPVKVGKPLMNEEGIISVIGITQSYLNQVAIMSNFDSAEVRSLMLQCNDTVVRDLMMNRVKYGILTPSARDKIHSAVLTYAFITLKRAYQEGEKRFWKGSQQEFRTEVVQGGRGAGQGLFGKMFGWAK